MKVKITGGWAKEKTGILVRDYFEEHFGVKWHTVDIQIIHRRKIKIVTLPAAAYEVIE